MMNKFTVTPFQAHEAFSQTLAALMDDVFNADDPELTTLADKAVGQLLNVRAEALIRNARVRK